MVQSFSRQYRSQNTQDKFSQFRHCYRDALREADISPDRVRALGGWTSKGGAEEIYGAGHRASTLAKEIEKVGYFGFDLDHLYL